MRLLLSGMCIEVHAILALEVLTDLVALFVISRILKNNQLIGAIPSTLSQLPNLKIL